MNDIKELRRLAQQVESGEAGINEMVAFVEYSEPKTIIELLDRLEVAEKSDAESLAMYRKARDERDALRAAVQHEADCVEAAKAEIEALRAKIEAMERQEPSHWGCTVLQSDGRWKEEVSREAPPEGYFSIRDIFPLYALPGAQPAWSSQAVLDITAERRRQIEVECWTPEHDDEHRAGEMAKAAACYALVSAGFNPDAAGSMWPWRRRWWKPSDKRRDLIKAGALILAEVERLDRTAEVERKMK